ncbi:hypothetical protein G7Y89_g2076 [Cudoniella acicularis]|uniref:Uncharacterized protein n=1 Tax=Cudoniella acicularis TaxID=354080 RepID=A0A8H4W7B7_9HELO|nr:hypothetical protein G7Y89_g2076 [Cudoniella acicularis]
MELSTSLPASQGTKSKGNANPMMAYLGYPTSKEASQGASQEEIEETKNRAKKRHSNFRTTAVNFRKDFVRQTANLKSFPLDPDAPEVLTCVESFLSKHAYYLFAHTLEAEKNGWPVYPQNEQRIKDALKKLMVEQEIIFRRNNNAAVAKQRRRRTTDSIEDEADINRDQTSSPFKIESDYEMSAEEGESSNSSSEETTQMKTAQMQNIQIHLDHAYPLHDQPIEATVHWLVGSSLKLDRIDPFVVRYLHEFNIYHSRNHNDLNRLLQDLKKHYEVDIPNSQKLGAVLPEYFRDGRLRSRCQKLIKNVVPKWMEMQRGGYGFLVERDGEIRKGPEFDAAWRNRRQEWFQKVHRGSVDSVLEWNSSFSPPTAIRKDSDNKRALDISDPPHSYAIPLVTSQKRQKIEEKLENDENRSTTPTSKAINSKQPPHDALQSTIFVNDNLHANNSSKTAGEAEQTKALDIIREIISRLETGQNENEPCASLNASAENNPGERGKESVELFEVQGSGADASKRSPAPFSQIAPIHMEGDSRTARRNTSPPAEHSINVLEVCNPSTHDKEPSTEPTSSPLALEEKQISGASIDRISIDTNGSVNPASFLEPKVFQLASESPPRSLGSPKEPRKPIFAIQPSKDLTEACEMSLSNPEEFLPDPPLESWCVDEKQISREVSQFPSISKDELIKAPLSIISNMSQYSPPASPKSPSSPTKPVSANHEMNPYTPATPISTCDSTGLSASITAFSDSHNHSMDGYQEPFATPLDRRGCTPYPPHLRIRESIHPPTITSLVRRATTEENGGSKKPQLQFAFEDASGLPDDDDGNLISRKQLADITLTKLFTFMCNKSGKSQSELTHMTFRFQWGNMATLVINKFGGEEYWKVMRNKMNAVFKNGQMDYPKKKKFLVWVMSGDRTKLKDEDEDDEESLSD